jgi:hypothetical protein
MQNDRPEKLATTQSVDVMKGYLRYLINDLNRQESKLINQLESCQKTRKQYEAMLSVLDVGSPIDDQEAFQRLPYYKTDEVLEQ